MTRILVIGDISLDLTLTTPHVPAPDEKVVCHDLKEGLGGVAANTAIAAARAGVDVVFAGCLGDDDASRAARHALQDAPLELRLSVRSGALCRAVTMVEPAGEKRLLLYPGLSIYPPRDAIEALDLDDIDHLHTAIYGDAGFRLIERARDRGITWSLDLEPATFPDGITQLACVIEGAEYVLVNDRAAEAIGPDAVGSLVDMGARHVIRTMGAKGASLHDAGKRQIAHVATPEGLPIVDTTGAGDCLAGWLLRSRQAGHTLETALTDAVMAATRACGRLGTQDAFPYHPSVQQEITT
ncbi:carbohydrate kinase family protein [Salinicola avicenniae]|uniref:carbohydrate kinase family protein n=1 Tax=Salinicola avicenniae TaxID=2916836 RepID=UPI002072F4DB|nr:MULTISPECIES: carbohydrate kinase family protein [unclassified Salinicola]